MTGLIKKGAPIAASMFGGPLAGAAVGGAMGAGSGGAMGAGLGALSGGVGGGAGEALPAAAGPGFTPMDGLNIAGSLLPNPQPSAPVQSKPMPNLIDQLLASYSGQ